LQLIGAVHGYFQQDTALMMGMLASLLTCGSVTLLAARYKSAKG
jgi:MtN3 and saliva related transmembrane protein